LDGAAETVAGFAAAVSPAGVAGLSEDFVSVELLQATNKLQLRMTTNFLLRFIRTSVLFFVCCVLVLSFLQARSCILARIVFFDKEHQFPK
jgi:hypothetical protein